MSQSDFVTRGQALVASGQFQEAVKVCRLGLLGRPTTVDGRIVLGQALLALKRYDEVLAEMRVALELDPGSISAQILKGEALLAKGDAAAALDVLGRVRAVAPVDQQKLTALLEEAKRGDGRPKLSASHPAVGYVGGTQEPTNESTKHYPNHSADEEDTEPKDDGIEDTGGSFTRPTSLSLPSKKRSGKQQAMAPSPAPPPGVRKPARGAASDYIPPPAVLAVGDRSGTVEVDPEEDGIELGGDDDFGEVAAPPSAGRAAAAPARTLDSARGSVKRSSRGTMDEPPTRRGKLKNKLELSSVELDSDDLESIDETPPPVDIRRPGPGTKVRNAVAMPSGPIDLPPTSPTRPTQPQAVPPLAQVIAQQPHMMQMSPLPPPQPLPQPPQVNPRSQIAAALPTAAAQPMPLPPAHMQQTMAPGRMPMSAAQEQSAAAVDALFGAEHVPPGGPAWARSTVVAGSPNHVGPQPLPGPQPLGGPAMAGAFQVGAPPQMSSARAAADAPTSQPAPIDPRISVELGSTPSAQAFNDVPISVSTGKPHKTGMRRGRSKLAVAMWILVGAAVIGGGVFAGFQIRNMRLQKQIAAARDQAVSLAKADTWAGWAGARDRLAGIARASSTVDNRAALARARAVLAYEFGDGLAEAKAALDKLAGTGGVDTAIATAYIALADNDAKAAKSAADRAIELAPNDAAALYVAGQAALLGGDHKVAIANLKASHEREPRPLYAVGLARAIGYTGATDDALTAVDRALGAMPDHPAALIERALLLTAGGRIAPGQVITAEVRTALVKLISEGGRPLGEQTRGVSPVQVALANIALAQVDFALRDVPAALAAIKAAADVNVEDQRFAEETLDTLYAFNQLERAESLATAALTLWPSSRRARVAQAQTQLARGRAAAAFDILAKHTDAAATPRGLAVQGIIKHALGDIDGARADLDASLKKLPTLELALVGRAWVDLADADLEAAKKRIEPRFNENYASVSMTTVYAAILRASGDVERAKKLLEKAVVGPAGVDMSRAHLELGRVLRDLGDMRGAGAALAEALRMNPSVETRLENALLQIENTDPLGGRDTLNQLLEKEPTAMTNPRVLLEGARARMLAGDHIGAAKLLDAADKLPTVERWKLDRERGRLSLRKGDVTGALAALTRAIDGSGPDAETFLLAADLVTVDAKATAALAQKLKALVPVRLANQPEALIVNGKLAIAAENPAEAEKAYAEANDKLRNHTPRRLAQASFGLAVVAFYRGDDPTAQNKLVLVIQADPSIYSAYLFAAEIAKSNDSAAFDYARKAVTFNPDYVDGWYKLGSLAAKMKKKKDLDEAIKRLTEIAPKSAQLEELQALR